VCGGPLAAVALVEPYARANARTRGRRLLVGSHVVWPTDPRGVTPGPLTHRAGFVFPAWCRRGFDSEPPALFAGARTHRDFLLAPDRRGAPTG
jgi:hypothetical protein